MFRELRLENWKSFKKATFYIDPLTILIGTNASGKSNLLDALLFLNRACSGVGLFQAINGDVNIPPLRGGTEWVCRKGSNSFSLEILVDGSKPSQTYRYRLTVQVNGTKAEVFKEELVLMAKGPRQKKPTERSLFVTGQNDDDPGIPAYFSTRTQGRGKRIDLNRSFSVLSQVETLNLRKEIIDGAKLVISLVKKIFVFDPIPSHMRDYSVFSEELQSDGANIAGVLAGIKEHQKDEIEEILTKWLKKLPEKDIKRVWTEPVGKFRTDAMLYCEEGWQDAVSQEVDARGMSDGTLRYLSIATALLTRKSGSLLVIEEVDNGLHPSRARYLIDMLRTIGKERNIDVIVTTHNPAILDAAGPGMVPFITVVHRDSRTGTSQLTLLEDIQQLPKLIAGGSLGRLATEGRIHAALHHGEIQ